MDKKLALLLVIALGISIFILPTVVAVGLSGEKLGTIVFEPNKVLINHYVITNTDMETKVSVGGSQLSEYFSISEVINNEFDLIISFPDRVDIPQGTYPFSLSVEEVQAPGASGLSPLTSVSRNFQVEIYSYEKDISVSFSSPSVNEGNPVNFKLDVRSRTYSDIDSIKGIITIYDEQDKLVGTAATEEKPLKSLAAETLTASFDTKGLPASNYRAEAKVFYDGRQKVVNNTFKIGNMDLVIKEYTQELEQGFSEFAVKVANGWGSELRNVYAKLFIEGQELLQTPSMDLAPWAEGELKGITKVDLVPGQYKGVLTVHFEGEFKEKPIIVTVILPKETPKEAPAEEQQPEKSMVPLLMIGGISIILIAAVLLAIFLKKKKEDDEF